MNRARIASLLAGTVAVSAGGWLLLRAPAKPAEPAPVVEAKVEANTVTPPEEPALARGPGCSFEIGAELSYAMTATVEMRLEGAKALGDAPPNMARTARSLLDLRALSTSPKGTVMVARYRAVDPTLTADFGDLGSPFLVRIDPQCQITAFARLATTGVREARAQQAMTYNLVWSWPKTQGASETRTGMNDFGQFRATYHDRTAQRPRVERTIDGFSRVWSDEWGQTVAQAQEDGPAEKRTKLQKPLASAMTIEPGAGPWFETLQGTERVSSMGSQLESRISAQLQATPPKVLDGLPIEESRYVWEDLLQRKVKTKSTPKLTAQELKAIAEVRDLSLDQAMTRFMGHVKANENISESWPHLQRYLVARPEAATALGQQIKEGKLPEEGSAGVFIALGKTPTTEARDALLGLKSDPSVQVFDRARAAFSLADRDDVGIELARAFRAESQAIATAPTRPERLYARHAALALGMMAAQKGDEDTAIADEARGAIRDILSKNHTPASMKPAFGTAANLGDPSMLSAVMPFTRHADAHVRRNAAISIRRMPPAATRAMTVTWLQSESDADVKRELYRVVRLQHHDAKVVADHDIVLQAIADLDQQPGVLTRQSILRLLGEAKDEYPEAKAALLASVPRELELKEDGVFPLLTDYLTGEEVASMMPNGGSGR